jgi:hypothetical protein
MRLNRGARVTREQAQQHHTDTEHDHRAGFRHARAARTKKPVTIPAMVPKWVETAVEAGSVPGLPAQ